MEHILDIEKQEEALNSIFSKIKESNTILFLGAGASVGVYSGQADPSTGMLTPL